MWKVKNMEKPLILVINPGSMTTKVALYKGEEELACKDLEHTTEEFALCKSLYDQLPIRKAAVIRFVEENSTLERLEAIACRGAPLKPLSGGTYRVNELMVADIKEGRLQSPHVSMLAALIGWEIAQNNAITAYITDPISVDEFTPVAKLTGFPEIPRKSLWHALNCRAVAKRFAGEHGKVFEDLKLIIAHMGSGITVACLEKGKSIDSTNANSEAPYSPERSGTLPVLEFAELCYSGKFTKEEMIKKVTRGSGLKAHLGTNDALVVEKRIGEGDEKALTLYKGMAYYVSKTIGSLAAVLCGKVDAILLTGSLARSEMLCKWIEEHTSFIAPVYRYPGQEEMKSLVLGVLNVMNGTEKEKKYE